MSEMLRRALIAAAAVAVAGSATAQRGFPKPVSNYDSLARETGLIDPSANALGRMAVDVGGKEWPVTVSFRCHAAGGHVVSGLQTPAATKVFDDLFYIGDADVSSWALNTPDGIIVLDALTTEQDGRDRLEQGLRAVGLDPKRVKYILISHEHGDHYGGAPYLKSLSGARIGMSGTAWTNLEQASPRGPLAQSPKPARDLVLTDGGKITLGGYEVTTVATPGHTPGTMSFILPVHDGGRRHMAAFWGGNGFPARIEDRRTFLRSIDHFAGFTDAAKVDVELAVHGDTDDLVARLAKRRAGGGANPFVVGRESYLRYEEIYRLCSRARIAQAAAAGGAAPAE